MNSAIDYTNCAALVREAIELRPRDRPSHVRARALEAQLHFLQRAENIISERLHGSGMSAEAAAHSAFEFVRQCIELHTCT